MKCPQCNKLLKENTEGNNRYCQGHSILSVAAYEEKNKHCFECGNETNHHDKE
jgi:hypothetical protein